MTAPVEPDTDLDIEIDPSQFHAAITAGQIDGIVSEYMSNPVVTGTAAVMGGKMMEATVQSILMEKIAGFAERLAGYIGSSFTVDQNKIASAFRFNMDEAEQGKQRHGKPPVSGLCGPGCSNFYGHLSE